MAIATKFVLASFAAGLLLPAGARADEACGRGEEGLVFGAVVAVEGSDGPFRLLCRNGQLTAVPVDATGPSEDTAIDLGGPPVSIQGTTTEPEAPTTLGAAAGAPEADTGLNAAGVAGQVPAATITQSAAEAATGPSRLPPVDQRGDDNASKPGVSARDAAAGGIKPGDAKSTERIEPDATGSAPETEASREMVRVPAAIVSAARQVLPGVAFKNVTLSRDGASTIYGLAGENQSGRGVAVDVDQAGTVLRVDRQIGKNEVPEEISRLSEAVLPGAQIDKAVMSIRPNFQSFFVFSGKTAADQDFALEIRTDGRRLDFLDPR